MPDIFKHGNDSPRYIFEHGNDSSRYIFATFRKLDDASPTWPASHMNGASLGTITITNIAIPISFKMLHVEIFATVTRSTSCFGCFTFFLLLIIILTIITIITIITIFDIINSTKIKYSLQGGPRALPPVVPNVDPESRQEAVSALDPVGAWSRWSWWGRLWSGVD